MAGNFFSHADTSGDFMAGDFMAGNFFCWKLFGTSCHFWRLYGRKHFGRRLFGRIPHGDYIVHGDLFSRNQYQDLATLELAFSSSYIFETMSSNIYLMRNIVFCVSNKADIAAEICIVTSAPSTEMQYSPSTAWLFSCWTSRQLRTTAENENKNSRVYLKHMKDNQQLQDFKSDISRKNRIA